MRTRRAMLAFAALALVAASCGDDNGSSSSTSSATGVTSATSATAATTTAAGPAAPESNLPFRGDLDFKADARMISITSESGSIQIIIKDDTLFLRLGEDTQWRELDLSNATEDQTLSAMDV